MSTSLAHAWQQALAAEYAAVFGYGVLGPHLTAAPEVALARRAEQEHVERGERTSAGLLADRLTPVLPQPDYPLPFPVVTADAARRLAIRLEEATASAWRYVVAVAVDPGTPSDGLRPASVRALRAEAQTALTACAVGAVSWRRLVTPDSPSVPFPGIG